MPLPPPRPPSLDIETLRTGLLVVAAALAVSLFVRRERRHLAHLAVLYFLSFLMHGAEVALHGASMPGASATAGYLADLLQGMFFLGVAAVVLFGVLLPLLRISTPRIVRDLTIGVSYLALVLYLFSTQGVDLTGIIATSAVATAVLGFSLQDTLANIMGGVALQLDGSVQPGDWVKFGDVSGKVREVGWRQTSIESRNGDTLVVPNSVLAKNPFLVQGRNVASPVPKERRWVFFGVDYRTSPVTVIDTVTESILREPIPNVAETPAPNVVLMEFKDSWASYAVRYWLTDLLLDDPTDSVVRTRVAYALRRADIPLSIPAATVHMKEQDEARRLRHAAEEREARIAALETVAFFQTLTAEERASLADGLEHSPFAPGEAMTVQGRQVHYLYILTRGSAEVRVSVEGAPPRAVARIEAPSIFGEMGMLTGEPRKATVTALVAVECWRLGKEKFRQVLEARPAIAKEISEILATRDVELAAAREGLSEEAKKNRLELEHRSLLSRIESFFGIS